jgi:IclR family acetate operon transcriptional repressor
MNTQGLPIDGLPSRPTRIQSVARAIRALLAIADSQNGLTATRVAAQLDTALPTTFHLLNTLVDEGLVAKDQRRYYLGPEAGRIAEGFAGTEAMTTSLRAPLADLARTTLETAYLAVWRHGQVVVVGSIEGAQAVKVDGLGLGTADDAHARASGKMLLATLEPAAVDVYLATHPLRRMTDNTITDEQQLREHLRKTRRRGYAIDNEEYREGVICLAVPIEHVNTTYGTYSLSIPGNRYRARREQCLSALRHAADQAVHSLTASHQTPLTPATRRQETRS